MKDSINTTPPTLLVRVETAAEHGLYHLKSALLVPILLLAVAFICYTITQSKHAFEEGLHVFTEHSTSNEKNMFLFELVEQLMTLSFLYMLLVGTYQEMISKLNVKKLPTWIKHLTVNSLKVKLGVNIIGLSSVHLVGDFINENVSQDTWIKHCIIHLVLVVSAFTLKKCLDQWLGHTPEEDESPDGEASSAVTEAK